jgi:hypothetical protein
MSPPDAAALRLKAIVEADPGALIRLLQLFQIRNVTPSACIRDGSAASTSKRRSSSIQRK